jgi:hypothetical protein
LRSAGEPHGTQVSRQHNWIIAGESLPSWCRCAASRMLALLSDERLDNIGCFSAPAPVVSIPPASSERQPCFPEWR